MNPNGYQKLPNEEEDEPAQQTQQQEPLTTESSTPTPPPDDAPPPYEASDDPQIVTLPPTSEDDFLNQSPPLYTDIVKLPTYNESENVETDTEERTTANRSLAEIFYFVTRGDDGEQEEISQDSLGTDVGFILCFFLAFVFNGLGFIVAYCTTNTLSSHYGAMSGFGLSLVKWAFIVKHKEMLQDYFHGNEWLLYCIILLGWMIFLRGMFAYAQLKRYIYSRARLGLENRNTIE